MNEDERIKLVRRCQRVWKERMSLYNLTNSHVAYRTNITLDRISEILYDCDVSINSTEYDKISDTLHVDPGLLYRDEKQSYPSNILLMLLV